MDRRILLADVLDKIQKSNVNGIKTPFHIQWVTCDEKRGTGGEKKTIKRAVILKDEAGEFSPIGESEGFGKSKHPNHYEHSTRNIIDMDDPTKHPYKIHIRLIIQFDHKYVYW